MTAVIYNFNRPVENDTTDDAAEWLFSALGRYTSAELLELLYVGEEPGFFELMRGLFGLSDEGRMVLQNFLAASASRRTTVSIDRQGRCVLALDPAQDLPRDRRAQDHRRQPRVRQRDPA
jgi:uracil-DNA glycosylase